jgi:hypothetical protein
MSKFQIRESAGERVCGRLNEFKILGPTLTETGPDMVRAYCTEAQAQQIAEACDFAWAAGEELGWLLVEPFQPFQESWNVNFGVAGLGLELKPHHTEGGAGMDGEELARVLNRLYQAAACQKTGVRMSRRPGGGYNRYTR